MNYEQVFVISFDENMLCQFELYSFISQLTPGNLCKYTFNHESYQVRLFSIYLEKIYNIRNFDINFRELGALCRYTGNLSENRIILECTLICHPPTTPTSNLPSKQLYLLVLKD